MDMLRVVPAYARKALNKYNVVDDESILFERYKEVENLTPEDANRKILEYEKQDGLFKDKYDWWCQKIKRINDFRQKEGERQKKEQEHVEKYNAY